MFGQYFFDASRLIYSMPFPVVISAFYSILIGFEMYMREVMSIMHYVEGLSNKGKRKSGPASSRF